MGCAACGVGAAVDVDRLCTLLKLTETAVCRLINPLAESVRRNRRKSVHNRRRRRRWWWRRTKRVDSGRRRRCVRRRRRCVTGSAAAWRSPNIVRAGDRGAVCRRCVAVRTAQSRLRATEQMRHCVLSVKDSRCIRSALPSSCRGRWRRRSWRRGGGGGWVASRCCVKQRPDRQAVARSRKSGEVIEVLRR